MDFDGSKREAIRTALVLAAGSGIRLQPLTNEAPKCLTEISGVPLLQRLVRCLRDLGITRLVVVVGHLDRCIRDVLGHWTDGMVVDYVVNPRYENTNNLYSLWLARNETQEPFMLVECDLIFRPSLLARMLQPDRIAISHLRPWMNGTTVRLDSHQNVASFHDGIPTATKDPVFKTVNIYSFSLFSWRRIKVSRAG